MADRPVVVTGAAAAPEFTEETDLALGRFGGQIVFATDGTSYEEKEEEEEGGKKGARRRPSLDRIIDPHYRPVAQRT